MSFDEFQSWKAVLTESCPLWWPVAPQPQPLRFKAPRPLWFYHHRSSESTLHLTFKDEFVLILYFTFQVLNVTEYDVVEKYSAAHSRGHPNLIPCWVRFQDAAAVEGRRLDRVGEVCLQCLHSVSSVSIVSGLGRVLQQTLHLFEQASLLHQPHFRMRLFSYLDVCCCDVITCIYH